MGNPRTNGRPMTRPGRFRRLGGPALALILVASPQLAAQTAGLAGTVVDQAGQVVQRPGLTLTDRATGEQLHVIGHEAGYFEFTDLEPGEYSLVVAKPGFARLFRRIPLEAGERIDEGLVLELGSVEETITVTDTGGSPSEARTISAAARDGSCRTGTRGAR